MSSMAPLWRYLPNTLSVARIGAAPLLGYLAASGAEQVFTWVLVPALLSDVADGYVARRFGFTSQLGALLDSVADALLFFVAVFAIWALHPQVLHEHAWAGLLVAGGWVVEIAVALVRYGRLSSFHTYASKVSGYLLGILIAVLFVWGLSPLLLYAAVTASVVATVEELALIGLLPTWRTNVRGLYWVLRERRQASP